MTKIIIDSSAWIEYLIGTERGEKVNNIINQSLEIITLPITLAEIVSKTKRSKIDPKPIIYVIKSISKIVDENELALLAGEIHGENKPTNKKLSLTDAFIIAASRTTKSTIITCDYDFKDFKEVKIIK